MSYNVNDVMMIRVKPKSVEEHGVITNKSVLETEKERNNLHKELEFIEVQLQGKREHRAQNRRNVSLGSLHDQPKSYTVKDGFLLHFRRG